MLRLSPGNADSASWLSKQCRFSFVAFFLLPPRWVIFNFGAKPNRFTNSGLQLISVLGSLPGGLLEALTRHTGAVPNTSARGRNTQDFEPRRRCTLSEDEGYPHQASNTRPAPPPPIDPIASGTAQVELSVITVLHRRIPS